MSENHQNFKGMSLFTYAGERKYLSASERRKFYKSLSILSDPVERTFVEMIYWTGCRPSEALTLTSLHIDLDEGIVIIRSLKKRGELKGRHFRPVPVPKEFLKRLDQAHNIHSLQNETSNKQNRLWAFGRTKGWRLMKSVMDHAGISGVRGCAKGLRHTLGVHAVITQVPINRVKSWLGHASLETTAIYLDAVGAEDHAIAKRMWQETL